MTERQIDEVWVASALRCAEVIVDDAADPQLKHALKRIPEADNKVLRGDRIDRAELRSMRFEVA